jgi:hypothetical protein
MINHPVTPMAWASMSLVLDSKPTWTLTSSRAALTMMWSRGVMLFLIAGR